MGMYAKSITAFAVGVVMIFLNKFGITDQSNVVNAIQVIVTTFLVWAVPNKA